jgi:hypothetical protein
MRILTVVVAFLVLPGVLAAAPNQNARFALHVKAPLAPEDTTPLCGPGSYDPNQENLPCSGYTVSRAQIQEWPGPVVYLVVGHADSVGILAVSFGLDYDGGPGTGIDPAWVTWTGCTDGYEFFVDLPGQEWPRPGAGGRVTWVTCQNQWIGTEGVHVVIGALEVYAYSEAALWLTTNDWLQSGPEMTVTTCDLLTTDLFAEHANDDSIFPRVRFGGSGRAWNPCLGTVPARPTTWGRIKRQYRP